MVFTSRIGFIFPRALYLALYNPKLPRRIVVGKVMCQKITLEGSKVLEYPLNTELNLRKMGNYYYCGKEITYNFLLKLVESVYKRGTPYRLWFPLWIECVEKEGKNGETQIFSVSLNSLIKLLKSLIPRISGKQIALAFVYSQLLSKAGFGRPLEEIAEELCALSSWNSGFLYFPKEESGLRKYIGLNPQPPWRGIRKFPVSYTHLTLPTTERV